VGGEKLTSPLGKKGHKIENCHKIVHRMEKTDCLMKRKREKGELSDHVRRKGGKRWMKNRIFFGSYCQYLSRRSLMPGEEGRRRDLIHTQKPFFPGGESQYNLGGREERGEKRGGEFSKQ